MLHRAGRIRGAAIRARDGEIGALEDFYFEPGRWVVRYLLVDTGKWLSGRRVLLSPMSVTGEWSMAEVPVALTKEQVWKSPALADEQQLSREWEGRLLSYYGHPYYWGESGIWGAYDSPGALVAEPARRAAVAIADRPRVDVEAEHLRSTGEITGYHLHATDGEIGHVDDFLIGQESWRIRYLLVDTSNWIGGKHVVVSTEAIKRIDRTDATLHVALTRNQIKDSPSFETLETALGTGETGPPFVII